MTAATSSPAAAQAKASLRQRGQRALLRISATLHGAAPDGTPFAIPVQTLRVTPRGAKIASPLDVPRETHLVLEHNGTHERQPCRIIGASQSVDSMFQIPIEFEGDAPEFWQIAFPPPG